MSQLGFRESPVDTAHGFVLADDFLAWAVDPNEIELSKAHLARGAAWLVTILVSERVQRHWLRHFYTRLDPSRDSLVLASPTRTRLPYGRKCIISCSIPRAGCLNSKPCRLWRWLVKALRLTGSRFCPAGLNPQTLMTTPTKMRQQRGRSATSMDRRLAWSTGSFLASGSGQLAWTTRIFQTFRALVQWFAVKEARWAGGLDRHHDRRSVLWNGYLRPAGAAQYPGRPGRSRGRITDCTLRILDCDAGVVFRFGSHAGST